MVVGSDISGLVTATLLAISDYKVTVLERRLKYAETKFLKAHFNTERLDMPVWR